MAVSFRHESGEFTLKFDLRALIQERSRTAALAVSKSVPFQWRKKGGRWPVAARTQCASAIQVNSTTSASDVRRPRSLAWRSHDGDAGSHRIREPQRLYAQGRVGGFRSQRNEKHLIVIGIDDGAQRGFGLSEPQIVQRTLKDGKLQPRAVAFQGLRHSPQALRVRDIVAHQVAATDRSHDGGSRVGD